MSKFLSKVVTGKIKKPHLVLVYGVDSVGKSTFGAQAPKPIFIGAEDGTNNLDIARLPQPEKWADIEAQIAELTTEKHDYKTLVVDSLDWLEPFLHQSICERYGVKSIELAAGGYGKGFGEAVNEWIKFNKTLSNLREKRGMNIVLIAHSEVVKFNDPATQSEYDRYQLKLFKKSAALFREFVDCVLFANFEVFAKKDGTKTRAFGDGVRVLYTERRPGYDAKNRFGLPQQLPLSWDDFTRACENDRSQSPDYLRESIAGLLESVTDTDLKNKVTDAVEKAGNDPVKLEAIQNRLMILTKGE